MNKYLFTLLTSLIVISMFLNPEPLRAASSPKDLLQKVQTVYKNMKTFEAAFVQESIRYNVLGNQEKVTQEGYLKIKKPGKIRWDYQTPEKKQYISDGKLLWLYTPQEKQVIVQDWDPQSLAMQFLLGEAKYFDYFDVKAVSGKHKKALSLKGEGWIYLKPLAEKKSLVGPIESLFLKVDTKKHLIRTAWAIDPIGARTMWSFRNMKTNENISDKEFTFIKPKDVQAIRY